MHKIVVSAVAAVSLLSATAVSAQGYSLYTQTNAGCVSLSRDLSIGSRGSDVSSLQRFLVAQNYPGSGSWMVTGYFGQATAAAVRNYQTQRGLAVTGLADGATRAAIGNCGAAHQYSGTPQYSYNWNYGTAPYTTPANPYGGAFPYNYNYNYNNAFAYPYSQYSWYQNYQPSFGTITLTSLSKTYAAPGSVVTVYGSGFDYAGNTVYIGGTTIPGIPSYNGTSLNVTVPNVSGSASVSVGNSRGMSNALTLTVSGGQPAACGTYPYGPCAPVCGGYGYGYGYGGDCFAMPISVSYITPVSGAVGTSVTVYGTGFSRTGNTVRFGNGVIANLNSFDGSSLTFTVPSQLSGYGYQPIGLGTYDVSVVNASGAASNKVQFTITALGTTNTPTITSVTGPTTLAIGSTGTWTITVSAPNNTYTTLSVKWGDEYLYANAPAASQTLPVSGTQTFTFTHAYNQAGSFTATFTAGNQYGQQNSATASVLVTSGTSGTLSLASIVPNAGRVGTQIALNGSGFTPYGNVVHFGLGGQANVPSYNGTVIYYTIPAWITPCDPSAAFCTMIAQQVTPGTYPVYVTNSNGTSATLNFTVTQ